MKLKGGFLTVIFIILSLISISTPSSSKEIKSDRDVILVLGKGMSELRYMLGVFALIGANIKYKAPKRRLKSSIKEYEERITALQKRYSSGRIAESLEKTLKAWLSVKDDLVKVFNTDTPKVEIRKRAIDIHSKIRAVIKELEHMKNIIVEESDLLNIKELNAAIEINSSIRRISSHYYMKMWNLDDPTIYQHWDRGLKIYRDSLDTLQHSKFLDDRKFNYLLDVIRDEYNFFMMLRRMSESNMYTPALMEEHTSRASKVAIEMIEKILDWD
jgi:hypothetical protein